MSREVRLAVLLLVGLLATALLPFASNVQSATVPYTLWGSAGGGWGFTSGGESNPGPTLYANEGDIIQLTLSRDDTAPHFWFLDYDDDGTADPGEPISPSITTNTFFSFVADTPGVFTYRCSVHPVSMTGTLAINATDQPPVATISVPDGTQIWTGGSTHDVAWTMTDEATPVTGLLAWLNYSYNAGANVGTIAGPVAGSANPHSVSWSVPSVDATDVTINLTVLDGAGLLGFDEASVPVVDSTPPEVTSADPADGVSDVPLGVSVSITFSEAMDQPITEGTVSLFELPSWSPVSLTVQGWSGNTLTLQPTSLLAYNTTYAGNVSGAAEDVSDPGNAMGAPYSWTFTTTATDMSPPTAAITPPSGSVVTGTPATFSANGSSDDSGVIASYIWEVRDTNGTLVGTGSLSYLTFTFPVPGTYSLTLTVGDASGNLGSTTLPVTVEPALSITITEIQADPAAAEVPAAVNLSAVVTSTLSISEVWFDVNGLGNFTGALDVSAGLYFTTVLVALPGTYNFTVAAVDASGQWSTATASFQAVDTTPPIIDHTPADSVQVLSPLDLDMNITDNDGLLEAFITYTDVRGVDTTVPFDLAQGPDFMVTLPPQPYAGIVSYTLYATDLSGNEANATHAVSVVGSPPFPALFGAAGEGWGFGPDNMTVPGPVIDAEPGETVTIILIGLDGAPHFFYLDVDGDGVPDDDEPRSAEFLGNTATVTFTAPEAGEYTYYCGIHPNTMKGTFLVRGEGEEPQPTSFVPVLIVLGVLALVTTALIFLMRRRGPREPVGEEETE